MFLLTSLALAADSDLVLDLDITGPLGDAIVDEEVALPYSNSIEKVYGKGTYRIDIEAHPVGRKVLLDVTVTDTRSRTDVKVADMGLELLPESTQDADKTILAPKGLKKDGKKVQYATFAVEASWRWNSGDWPQEARKEAVKPGELVVVWEDTPLFTAASADAPNARLRPAERRPGMAGYLPLEVVEDQGEWVKVRTGAVSDSCHTASASRLDDASLELYVQRSELLLVTAATVAVEYDDGSRFQLEPGVVVIPAQGKLLVAEGELLMKADAGDVVADITLPAGSLALSFAPTAPKPPEAKEEQVLTSSNFSLGETASGEVYWLGQGPAYLQGFWEAPVDPEAVVEDEENYVGDATDQPDVGQARGIVAGSCSVHSFHMLPSRIKPAGYVANEGARDSGEVLSTEFVSATWAIKEGTALTWADGGAAGTATHALELEGEPRKSDDKKVKCGTVSLDGTPVPRVEGIAYEADPEGIFEVCFDAKAVTKL